MQEHNRYYLKNRNTRAIHAKKHTEEMKSKYSNAIKECVKNTKIYDQSFIYRFEENETPCYNNVNMRVVEQDAVNTLFSCVSDTGKTALLNFASYKHPGGGFINGSRAQEESLCHESFLYNVLKEFETSYYEINRQDLNRGLYRNKALYSPCIIFEKDDAVKTCDVLTCASPNFSVAEKFISREENNAVLRDRIRFVLEIAKNEKVETLILGSWGCGVFKQDPKVVANYFIEECDRIFVNTVIDIIFAVIPPLPHQTDNCTPFVSAVHSWNDLPF